jgi:hypothetical protein
MAEDVKEQQSATKTKRSRFQMEADLLKNYETEIRKKYAAFKKRYHLTNNDVAKMAGYSTGITFQNSPRYKFVVTVLVNLEEFLAVNAHAMVMGLNDGSPDEDSDRFKAVTQRIAYMAIPEILAKMEKSALRKARKEVKAEQHEMFEEKPDGARRKDGRQVGVKAKRK